MMENDRNSSSLFPGMGGFAAPPGQQQPNLQGLSPYLNIDPRYGNLILPVTI